MFQVCSTGVMHGVYNHPIRGLYVGEHPEGSHVDAVSVYCSSCGSWLGRRIVRIYIFHRLIHFLFDILILRLIIMTHMLQIRLYVDHHPVIRQGQFVLVCGGAGIEPVFPMQNFL